MTSRSRLDWMISQVHAGRSAAVAFSYDPRTEKNKSKFVLDNGPLFPCSPDRPCIFGAVNAVATAMEYNGVLCCD